LGCIDWEIVPGGTTGPSVVAEVQPIDGTDMLYRGHMGSGLLLAAAVQILVEFGGDSF